MRSADTVHIFDAVAQLPHVPLPVIGEEEVPHAGIERVPFGAVPTQKLRDEIGDIPPALPQGRDIDDEGVEPVVQVQTEIPLLTSALRSRFVAAMMRTSTETISSPPTRMISLSSNTRRSFAWVRSGSSPISSRNRVPRWAIWNRPSLPPRRAPVKAPSSYPKSSDSNSVSGIAAQFIATKGNLDRLEALWMDLREQLLARAALADDQRGLIDARDPLCLLDTAHDAGALSLDVREGIPGQVTVLCDLAAERGLEIGQLGDILYDEDVDVPGRGVPCSLSAWI